MSRLSAYCLIIAATAVGFTACNSSSDDLDEYELPSSALVKSFSISANSKVLDNLDKVFFSIDLINARIFNADSMPYGTDVHALVPEITTSGVSALELVVPRPGKSDTTYNYLTNPTDSIDFSNGPVTMKLTSYNEAVTVNYTISVNVHQVKSDSLAWGNVAYTKLPTSLSSVVAQQTVKFDGKAYCLTTDGDRCCMSTSLNPGSKQWESREINLGFSPRVETFRASDDALYLLADTRKLYKSTDHGTSWHETSYTFDFLIGGYEDKVIGTVKDNGIWKIANSIGESINAPADFPVSGASHPIEYTFPMSDSRQMTIVGGRLANGELTGSSWGYDGTNWAKLSNGPIPEGLEGVAVFPYFTFEENSYWVATEYSIFVAVGGKRENGECNDSTYISYNYGMSWKKAPELMQLPENVPAMANAQALVFPTELTVSPRGAMSEWTEVALKPLPPFWSIVSGKGIASRASTAITSWECPYIYVFGGENEQGETYDTVWRAVVNRLTFKPLQ